MKNKSTNKSNRRTKFSDVIVLSKRIFTKDVMLLVFSTIISVCIEMIRQAIWYAKKSGNLEVEKLYTLFKVDKLVINDAILNIIMVALIIWAVTGALYKKEKYKQKQERIERKEEREEPKSLYIIVVVLFIIAIIWYITEVLFQINETRNWISAAVCFSLFISLALYFADEPKNRNKFTDTCIAPMPSQAKAS